MYKAYPESTLAITVITCSPSKLVITSYEQLLVNLRLSELVIVTRTITRGGSRIYVCKLGLREVESEQCQGGSTLNTQSVYLIKIMYFSSIYQKVLWK